MITPSTKEIAIVVGAGMTKTGEPVEGTILRARKAIELALANPKLVVILSGGRAPSDRGDDNKTEAEEMAKMFDAAGISRNRLLLEDQSFNTIGNAVRSAFLFLSRMTPCKLYLVTSPFHMARTLIMFQGVLKPQWEIIPVECEVAADDAKRGTTEQGGIDWAERFFTGLVPGDINAAVAKLRAQGPDFSTYMSWEVATVPAAA